MDFPGLIAICLAYATGCFNAAYYGVRWRTGSDIRARGSGNAGARNVGRILGPTAFLATLFLDAAKGAIAILIGANLSTAPLAPGLCAIAAVTGHVWPAQLGWRGGKGVATGIGAVLALAVLDSRSGLFIVLPVIAALMVLTHRGNLARWRRQVAETRHGDSTS